MSTQCSPTIQKLNAGNTYAILADDGGEIAFKYTGIGRKPEWVSDYPCIPRQERFVYVRSTEAQWAIARKRGDDTVRVYPIKLPSAPVDFNGLWS